MKKIIIVYLLLIVAVIALAIIQRGNINFLPFLSSQNKSSSSNPTATINKKTFKLLLAKSENERMIGLSNLKKLDKNTGMLFVFEEKGAYSFWMNNMKFPIDMLFISDDTIVTIVENAPTPSKNQSLTTLKRYKPSDPVNYVLELNAGQAKKYKIKQGNKVELKNIQ